MFPSPGKHLKFAAASVFVAFIAATVPASAGEMAQNLRPRQPILTTIGSKRVIAFYVPGNAGCNVQAVVWNADEAEVNTAAGIRVSRNPGQTAYLDSVDNNALTLQCGDEATSLAAVDRNPRLTYT